MIKISLFVGLLLASCWFFPKNQNQNIENKDTLISSSALLEVMDTLSSDYFEGREMGTPGVDKAAIYIENFLKKARIVPFFKQYRDTFSVDNEKAFNIIGLIKGNDPALKNEYIILSAHYDHKGKISGAQDSVYNGANDNASGVATVLNIAKIISANKSNKRSIIVALFTGEELGMLGSEHFANKIKGLFNINCAANVDMIGTMFHNYPGKVYMTGYHLSNMAEFMNKCIGSESILYWQEELSTGVFRLSDNYPLYEILKVPAHTFCTFDFTNYPYYHQPDDEMDKIDVNNTVSVVNNISVGIRKLAESAGNDIRFVNQQQ